MIIPTWPPSEFVNKIIDIFKECVPNKKSKMFYDDKFENWKDAGFNDCRTETLKNIEELR